uniref:G-protein coupled receptors family 1 profile domain-containing protein n=1 Tax=Branchiostoma floridae TaxID=7739 RepID=C3ZLQ9_BRAFL|eukprot:XP_002590521.1 hypothetical protein BRAFLDRAFT_86193 [Branchiostoma floridae]
MALENLTYAVNVTDDDGIFLYSNNTTASAEMYPSTLSSTNDSTIDALPTPASPQPTQGFIVGVAMVMGLLALVGTSLNGTVIFAVGFNKRLRTATGWFVANLAAGDLLETTVYLPFGVYTVITHRVPIHPSVCAALATIGISSKFTSLSCMALIAFHRYMLITKPKSTYKAVFTARNNVLIVLLAWLVSWTTAIPFVLGYGFIRTPSIGICVPATGSVLTTRRAVTGTLYALPLLTMLYSYTSIYLYVRKAPYNPDNPCIQLQQKKNMLKVAKNLAVLACVFCVLVFPSCILVVFGAGWPASANALVWIMYYANCCINAFMHIRNNSDFKKVCRKIFFCRPPQREQNQDGPRQARLGQPVDQTVQANRVRTLIIQRTHVTRLEPREPTYCELPTVST